MPELSLKELPPSWATAIRKIPAGSLPNEILRALSNDPDYKPNLRLRGLDDLVSRKEAAEILGVSIKSLEGWSRKGIGPAITKLSPKLLRYSIKALNEWKTKIKDRSE